MFDFFSDGSYYEFPSIQATIFALLLAFVLSTVIAFTHKFTYKGVNYSWQFFQAIVLSSIVATMVMMAIGDSLARGLGMLGALAIIRFRTLLRDPRNIIFIFAALSIGIATGVYGFAIAISGTVIFSGIAMVLSLYTSEMGSSKDNILVFSLENKDDVVRVEPIIEQHSKKNKLLSVAHNRQGFYRYEYLINLKNETDQAALFKTLDEMEILLNVRITNQEDLETL